MTAKSRRRKAARRPRKVLGPWDGTAARPAKKSQPDTDDDTSQE